jgi:chromate reductase, NAD(P)H dehydrogenase (quinone)
MDIEDSSPREPVRFLVFSASLREQSLNTRLAALAATCIEARGGTVDLASMRDFDAPGFDADVEASTGLPPGAQELQRRLEGCDAFVIAAPEYNASMPGVLKNAIDWASRAKPQPFHERHALLLSASPSMVGGNRGLWALRIPFEHLGARVFPDMFSLAQAHDAFDVEGRIASSELQQRFDETVEAFMDLVEAAKHYPCVKSRWIEFLGERPDPAVDRIE